MSGYTKLFSEIVDSSIWREPSDICKVWITLLALSDADGYIRGSPGWLAGKAHVSLATCEEALGKFQHPDHESRTPDNDGKRIDRLEDGWLILNYLEFRDRLSNDPKAQATRERVRKHRERYYALRNTKSVTPLVSASASVSASDSVSDPKEGMQGEKHSFKTWTLEEFRADCIRANVPQVLNTDEVEDFIGYWTGEKTANGRTKLQTQKTWDTRRRMQTAQEMVYSKKGISPANRYERKIPRSTIE